MKVSIITVCYNAEKTIERTINSVLGQTFSNIEYIIVDGKSTDNTISIIKKFSEDVEFAKKYPGKSMTVISEPDDGIYYAMNKGITLATGLLIGIINADDWYELDAIQIMINSLPSDLEECILYGNLRYWKDNELVGMQESGDDISCLEYKMAFGHPTCFVTLQTYRNISTFCTDYRIISDFVFLNKCYYKGIRFINTKKTIANFSFGGISTVQHLEMAKEYLTYMCKSLNWGKDIETKFNNILQLCQSWCFDEFYTKVFEAFNVSFCAVFGAGAVGTRVKGYLDDTSVVVDFWVDNDSDKWGENVKSPDTLKEYEGVLIVALSKYTSEILEQVKTINKSIKVYTIEDLERKALDFACSEDKRLKELIGEIYRLYEAEKSH